ncbi:hypothetical protein EIK80_11715 [Caulobacter sp. 602-1]|nr:hypothetical protein EIK80_11715 [Caulobacter sp. 602-1]
MGQRRKTGDGARLPAISRRAVIGATAVPFAETVRGLPAPGAVDIPAQCAAWVAVDMEITRLCNRWSELEVQAVKQFDYFNLTDAQISALPMGPEMDAVDAECRRLGDVCEEALEPLGKLTPRTIEDATAMLAIAYRLLRLQEDTPWPFVNKAWTFLSRAHCPGCGAAYAPKSLPVSAQ